MLIGRIISVEENTRYCKYTLARMNKRKGLNT